ncbi:inositol oxygenase family protein [Nostoc sp. ChiQUE01b]|uniref:inositol oxygenase family protein n=1 Tax=Nostoc sp. ChiQUE01b TaxID=3075376 RepID=UPI002AD4A52A|nr:inositol oxygenase family protein [Nostoc sp. ChiQUE01b]MDZ8264126.1 inositol oxygenase family protein [Nostoc sp. ChiQUE01b]
MSQTLNNAILRVQNNPLDSLEEWEEDLLNRYPDPDSIVKEGKTTEEYRNYETTIRYTVKEFYRLNHINQTYNFVLQKEKEFLKFNKKEMSVWDAVEFLNQLVDDSDPDTDMDQLQHLLQTSEAIRADGHPDDEYFYQMMKNYLPEPALYILRYHSFYPQHRENAYEHLMDKHDKEMFKWVRLFNPYDLYSKNPIPLDWQKLKPYYEDLVVKHLPATLKF